MGSLGMHLFVSLKIRIKQLGKVCVALIWYLTVFAYFSTDRRKRNWTLKIDEFYLIESSGGSDALLSEDVVGLRRGIRASWLLGCVLTLQVLLHRWNRRWIMEFDRIKVKNWPWMNVLLLSRLFPEEDAWSIAWKGCNKTIYLHFGTSFTSIFDSSRLPHLEKINMCKLGSSNTKSSLNLSHFTSTLFGLFAQVVSFQK